MIGLDDIFGQAAAVEFLRRASLAGRLPHAMIFAGPVGVGKGTCATALAGWFLCENPRGERACGQCESCRLVVAGNHPDVHVIVKELIRYHDKTGKSKGIDLSINVIRPELVEPAGRTAVMGRGKFFVVEQAELMSVAAQNAMLKTLEEPAGRSAIVLLTEAPELLLPTVLSRCQMVRFGQLDTGWIRERLEGQGVDAELAASAAELSEGSAGGAMQLVREGNIGALRELAGHIGQLISGRVSVDLPGWLKQAAEKHAEKELERDPLSSKDAAFRAGLNRYLVFIAGQFRRRLRQTTDAGELEQACAAIDAVWRCQMYLDANVNVPVALGQAAGAWAGEFAAA